MASYVSPRTFQKATAGTAVIPPDPVKAVVSAGGSFSNVTFAAFIDPKGLIVSYTATATNLQGTATISGSGLGPYTISGEADGESLVINLAAKDASNRVLGYATWAGTIALPTGGGSWVDLLDLDFTDLTTQSALSGSSTLTFDSSADTISLNVGARNGYNGTFTPTNGSGLVVTSGTDSSSQGWATMLISPLLSSYTYADVMAHTYAFHIVLQSVSFDVAGTSGFFVALQYGSNTTYSGGSPRGAFIRSNSNGTDDDLLARSGTANSSVLATATTKTSRVVTLILKGGDIISVSDTSGTTPPTPDPGAATTYMAGSASVGFYDYTPFYQDTGVRVAVQTINRGNFTMSRLLIQRFE